MGLAETARLAVQLDLKGNFASNLRANQTALGKFDKSITSSQGRAYKAGQQIGTGIQRGAVIAAGALGFLATNIGLGLRSLSELESVVAQSNAVLKSTKGIAGQTADSVRKLAEEYESLNATIDDKVIQSGENLLLTFTNIRKDAFEPALKAALDMNQALGRGESGLQGTIQQLGKALNDPIRGLTTLQRVGITFTKTQKDQIKTAVDAGDTFKAQGVILAELNKRFGGSFLAGGATTTGKVAKFTDAIEDLQKALAKALLPTIGKVADGLSKFLADPAVIRGVSDLGDSIASLFSDKNLASGGAFLKDAFETAKAAAPIVADAARATFSLVQGAVGLFRSLPPEVQKLAIGAFAINKLTGGLVTNLASGLISSVLKQLVSGVVNVSGGVVNVGGAGAVGGAAGKGKVGSIAGAVGKVFLVGAAVGVFAELAGILGDQTKANQEQSSGLSEQTSVFVKSASIEQMKAALAAIKDTSGYSLAQQLALNLNIDGVRDTIIAQQAKLEQAIAQAEAKSAAATHDAASRVKDDITSAGLKQIAATNRMRDRVESVRIATISASKTTASRISARIDGAKRAQVAANRATTQAIKDKDLSVKVNVTTSNTISLRDITRARTTFKTISGFIAS